ncbi:hypothetical protein VE03_06843 [Pseudogymnoascus sp. 23342-1-I1]|nr:hypothetical protein VE03_06843 [Pseudogymnoascus sp. 23342-1-I1]
MSTPTFQRVHRTPKVKQACDCCHARKIKCDGTCPCSHCAIAELQCTYLTVPKKKGPKGPSKRTPRAILKMQLEQQRNRIPPAAPSSSTQSIPPRDASTTTSPPSSTRTSTDYNPALAFEPSPLLTPSLVEQFAKSFFKHKYPLTPILHKGDFYAHTLPHYLTCPSKYALVASLCAAARTQVLHDAQADPTLSRGAAPLTTAYFINEVRRARAQGDFVETPTLEDAQASFFVFAGLFDCDKHNSAWFYLREAITLMESLRLHEEITYAGMPAREALFSRRMFWLLFITERAYALQRHRPLSLNATIGLPTATTAVDEDPDDAEIISGFLDLLALFRNFNSDFVSTWNSSSHSPLFSSAESESAAASISAKQLAELQDTLAQSAPPDDSQRTEIQKADLSITRLVLALNNDLATLRRQRPPLLLPHHPPPLTFRYPITLAASLAAVAAPLTPSAFDANGPGILEKIFDIGCSLADVLLLHPPRAEAMQCGPRESLREMMRVMGRAMGGRSRYRALLGEKAGEAMGGGRPSAGLGLGSGGAEVGEGRVEEEEDGGDGDGDRDGDRDREEVDVDLKDYEALRGASVAWVGALGAAFAGGGTPEGFYSR